MQSHKRVSIHGRLLERDERFGDIIFIALHQLKGLIDIFEGELCCQVKYRAPHEAPLGA